MFAKIFNQIYDSSIVESPETRFTFMDFLILADKNGVVDMTHEAISRRTNRPIELIRKTIAELEGPDPRSRTPDENGARIYRLDEHRDWGWGITNYDYFRKIASEEQRREKTRLRVAKLRKKRESLPDVTRSNADVTLGNDSPSASASPSALEGGVRGGFKRPTLSQVAGVMGNDRESQSFMDYYNSNGWKVGRNSMKDWEAAARNWVRRKENALPMMSSRDRQKQINHLNGRKQKINRLIKDPNNPPSWAAEELAAIDEQLQKL